MLKRKIAILIAGGLLSAQAGLAGAEQSGAWNLLPPVAKYLAERAASNPNPTGAKEPIFRSATASSLNTPILTSSAPAWNPKISKYLAERDARIRAERGPFVSVFDDCQMHSHGDVGFHS